MKRNHQSHSLPSGWSASNTDGVITWHRTFLDSNFPNMPIVGKVEVMPSGQFVASYTVYDFEAPDSVTTDVGEHGLCALAARQVEAEVAKIIQTENLKVSLFERVFGVWPRERDLAGFEV